MTGKQQGFHRGRAIFLVGFSLFCFFILTTNGYAQTRNAITMAVTGASDKIDTLQLNRGVNFYETGNLFTLSIKNSSRETGDLYVKLSYDGATFWFVEETTLGGFPVITLSEDKESLSTLPASQTAYIMNFSVPGPSFLDEPAIFVAYFVVDGQLYGMDSKTVFFNPSSFVP